MSQRVDTKGGYLSNNCQVRADLTESNRPTQQTSGDKLNPLIE